MSNRDDLYYHLQTANKQVDKLRIAVAALTAELEAAVKRGSGALEALLAAEMQRDDGHDFARAQLAAANERATEAEAECAVWRREAAFLRREPIPATAPVAVSLCATCGQSQRNHVDGIGAARDCSFAPLTAIVDAIKRGDVVASSEMRELARKVVERRATEPAIVDEEKWARDLGVFTPDPVQAAYAECARIAWKHSCGTGIGCVHPTCVVAREIGDEIEASAKRGGK